MVKQLRPAKVLKSDFLQKHKMAAMHLVWPKLFSAKNQKPKKNYDSGRCIIVWGCETKNGRVTVIYYWQHSVSCSNVQFGQLFSNWGYHTLLYSIVFWTLQPFTTATDVIKPEVPYIHLLLNCSSLTHGLSNPQNLSCVNVISA